MKAYYIQQDHPAPEVLSLTAAKKQLKVEDLGVFDDDIILDCIDAAIDEAESYINASIKERKYIIKADGWLPQDYEFREQKIQSIDAVSYIDTNGDTQALNVENDLALYPVDKYASIIHYLDADNLPEVQENNAEAVAVSITTGYASATVPKGLLQGIKLLVTENYNIRNNIETKSYRSVAEKKLEPYKYYRKSIE